MLLANAGAAPLGGINPPDVVMKDLLSAHVVPVKNIQAVMPVIEAKSALVLDVDSNVILFEKAIHEPMPMASLTKIMTALLILENHRLDEVVTVDHDYSGVDVGVRIWLHQYEKITVGDLLIGLLVPSGGDAALALASYHSGTVDAFVSAMNARATTLGMTRTRFTNPIGLDDDGHYSTAHDLALLTKQALRNADFRRIVRMPNATVSSTNGRIAHRFESTNALLNSYLNILGVKTGTTDGAGASLINLARNGQGREILAIVLNSPQRFQENKRLIDWSFRNFTW